MQYYSTGLNLGYAISINAESSPLSAVKFNPLPEQSYKNLGGFIDFSQLGNFRQNSQKGSYFRPILSRKLLNKPWFSLPRGGGGGGGGASEYLSGKRPPPRLECAKYRCKNAGY